MTASIHQFSLVSPAAQARSVIAVTAASWAVLPSSPQEIARRAPHGYVSLRARRRLHAAASAAVAFPLIAHSW